MIACEPLVSLWHVGQVKSPNPLSEGRTTAARPAKSPQCPAPRNAHRPTVTVTRVHTHPKEHVLNVTQRIRAQQPNQARGFLLSSTVHTPYSHQATTTRFVTNPFAKLPTLAGAEDKMARCDVAIDTIAYSSLAHREYMCCSHVPKSRYRTHNHRPIPHRHVCACPQSPSTISALSHNLRQISSASLRTRAPSLSKLCRPSIFPLSRAPRPDSKLARDRRRAPDPSISAPDSLKLVLRLLPPCTFTKPFVAPPVDDRGILCLRRDPGICSIRRMPSAKGLRYLRTTAYSMST
jgi:hypothetical protein